MNTTVSKVLMNDTVSVSVIIPAYNGERFIALSAENEYHAEIALIASGTKPRQFADGFVSKEAEKRVFYEVRDLLDISNEEIIIVGAGDTAFDYALNLTKRNNRVTILNRGKKIRALDLLVERKPLMLEIFVSLARITSSGEP